MSDFLVNLVARGRGRPPEIRPRPASRFDPAGAPAVDVGPIFEVEDEREMFPASAGRETSPVEAPAEREAGPRDRPRVVEEAADQPPAEDPRPGEAAPRLPRPSTPSTAAATAQHDDRDDASDVSAEVRPTPTLPEVQAPSTRPPAVAASRDLELAGSETPRSDEVGRAPIGARPTPRRETPPLSPYRPVSPPATVAVLGRDDPSSPVPASTARRPEPDSVTRRPEPVARRDATGPRDRHPDGPSELQGAADAVRPSVPAHGITSHVAGRAPTEPVAGRAPTEPVAGRAPTRPVAVRVRAEQGPPASPSTSVAAMAEAGPRDEPTPSETVVHVAIGRIEVRAAPAPAPSARRPQPAPAVMGLSDYLEQRARGGR